MMCVYSNGQGSNIVMKIKMWNDDEQQRGLCPESNGKLNILPLLTRQRQRKLGDN